MKDEELNDTIGATSGETAVSQNTGSSANCLIIGIDLGTSRTSVVTSRGVKRIFRSLVGYPKDIIGVRLLGAPYAVGDEAYEKRSFLDMRHPLNDGVIKETNARDMEAARHLLKHAVDIADPKPGDEVRAVIGVPARASTTNKSLLLQLADEILDVSVVISQPFLVAYHYGKLVNTLVIDIGAGTSDICALKGMIPPPDDQITIRHAGNYIDQRLMEAISDRYPEVQMSLNMARTIKEANSFVGRSNSPVSVELRANGLPVICDVTEEVRQACESIVPDLVESCEILLRRFAPEDLPKVLQNIVLAGGGSRITGLAEMVAAKLQAYGDVKVTTARDPEFDGASGALTMGEELPPKFWNQLGDMLGASEHDRLTGEGKTMSKLGRP